MADESKTAVGGVGKSATGKTTARKTEHSAGKRAAKKAVKKPAKKPDKKAVGKPAKKAARKSARKKPIGRQRKTAVAEAQDVPISGVEKLRLAADQLLFDIADEVVKKLKQNAELGQVACTRLLVTLADKKPVRMSGAKGNPDSIAWLLTLAGEPEFQGLIESGEKASPVVAPAQR